MGRRIVPDSIFNPVPLGATGYRVRAVGLGTARLGAFWQGRKIDDGRRALTEALNNGVDLVDTADCYARGLAERLVGRGTRKREVCVMTKVGLIKTPIALASAARHSKKLEAGRLSGLSPGPRAATCFESGYVRAAAHRCLRRQGTARLNVLLLHEPSAADLTAARFLPGMQTLLGDGEVVAWGAAVRDVDAARAALAIPGISVLQVPCSAVDVSIVDAVRAEAAARGVALIAIAALGDGQLLKQAAKLRPSVALSSLVAELAVAAVRTPGIVAVLLGMSTQSHVSDVLAALPGAGNDPGLIQDLTGAAS